VGGKVGGWHECRSKWRHECREGQHASGRKRSGQRPYKHRCSVAGCNSQPGAVAGELLATPAAIQISREAHRVVERIQRIAVVLKCHKPKALGPAGLLVVDELERGGREGGDGYGWGMSGEGWAGGCGKGHAHTAPS